MRFFIGVCCLIYTTMVSNVNGKDIDLVNVLEIGEFSSQRRYINLVPGILNLLPFPIYVGNRECPERNQIDARY